MVTTPVELATARRPSLAIKGACGICSRFNHFITSKTNLVVLVTPYLYRRVGGLPAPCRTPLQMPDEAFVLGQTVGQPGLGAWTAKEETRTLTSTFSCIHCLRGDFLFPAGRCSTATCFSAPDCPHPTAEPAQAPRTPCLQRAGHPSLDGRPERRTGSSGLCRA